MLILRKKNKDKTLQRYPHQKKKTKKKTTTKKQKKNRNQKTYMERSS